MFCGDDPSAKSSTLTCDSQHTFEDACVPVLYPADQQDVIDLGVHAFRLSRYAGTWVGLKVVTSVADGIGTVDLDPDRHVPSDPTDLVIGGEPWRAPAARHRRAPRGSGPGGARRRPPPPGRPGPTSRHNGLDRIVGAGVGRPPRNRVRRQDLSRRHPGVRRPRRHHRRPRCGGRAHPQAGHDLPAGARHRHGVRGVGRRGRDHRGEAAVRRGAAPQHPARGPERRAGGRQARPHGRDPGVLRRRARCRCGSFGPGPGATGPRGTELRRAATVAAAARRGRRSRSGLLQRMPAQPLDGRPRGCARRWRRRLSRDHVLRGAQRRHVAPAAHADGCRRRAVDRPGPVRRRAAPDPEHRRRHAQPFRHPRHPGQRGRPGERDLQDPLQRRGRHDRRPGSHRPHGRAVDDAGARGRGRRTDRGLRRGSQALRASRPLGAGSAGARSRSTSRRSRRSCGGSPGSRSSSTTRSAPPRPDGSASGAISPNRRSACSSTRRCARAAETAAPRATACPSCPTRPSSG